MDCKLDDLLSVPLEDHHQPRHAFDKELKTRMSMTVGV